MTGWGRAWLLLRRFLYLHWLILWRLLIWGDRGARASWWLVGDGCWSGQEVGDHFDEIFGDNPNSIVEVTQLPRDLFRSLPGDVFSDHEVHVAVEDQVGVGVGVRRVGLYWLLHLPNTIRISRIDTPIITSYSYNPQSCSSCNRLDLDYLSPC